jgi:UDP-glucose 4-epimerase
MPTICEADFSRALDLNEEHLNTVSQPNEGQGDAVIGLGLDRSHARKDGVEIIRSAKKRRGEFAGAGQRTVDNGLVVTRQEAVFRRLGLTRDNLLRLHS